MYKILFTVPVGGMRDKYFPPQLMARLETLGEVVANPHNRQYTREELMTLLPETDIIITHWGSPQYDAELLACAPRLKVLAHCAGTVAHIASETCYERGIPVLSANPVMAKYVAEGALAYILAGVRALGAYDRNMRAGLWHQQMPPTQTIVGGEIGLVGLGAVGRNLLDLLRPFGCAVKVYDPYLPQGALDAWDFASPCSFVQAMANPVVSVHASQTPETYHMIDAAALAQMPDDGLLVNTARGSLVDVDALIPELESGRLRAVLDVYEHENCPQDARLLACTKNLTLQPHLAGMPSGAAMTAAILDDLERFARGENLRMTVSHAQYLHMTQE
ncbi:MAG: hydroxyacid dehydrogenase [Clostridia bacterium]|nr:hydroxyacid dehydrogenase [Clostridia bacterium]